MKQYPTTVAIVSGKGGVGKSIVAVNMAEMLTTMGHRVALIDVDFGQGACAVLLNESPPACVLEYTRLTVRRDEVAHRTRCGISLVEAVDTAGRIGKDLQRLYDTLDELLDELRLTHDFILIDAPAGTDGAVRWALARADLGVLVLVGEPTAISDAYRLARMVWEIDPDYPLAAVVNFADTETEARSVAERFGKVTTHFTGRATKYLGWVPFSAQIRRSVSQQEPAVRAEGPVRNAFLAMAENLAREPLFAGAMLSLN